MLYDITFVDIVGEVAYLAAYAPRDPSEAISDARTRDAMGAYAAVMAPVTIHQVIVGKMALMQRAGSHGAGRPGPG